MNRDSDSKQAPSPLRFVAKEGSGLICSTSSFAKRAFKIAATTLATALLSFTAISAEEAPVTITELFKRDHPELTDKEIIVKRIELKPGASAPPHVHPGMVTGYVESGTMEFQIKGEALKILKKGDIFFEPPGSHHLVARNPDTSAATVVIAFVVNPKGAPLSTPLGDGKN